MIEDFERRQIRKIMIENTPGADAGPKIDKALADLLRLARRQHALHVRDCNTGADVAREVDATRAKIRALLEPHGLRAWFQSDPRGYVVRVGGPGVELPPDDGPTPHYDTIGVE